MLSLENHPSQILIVDDKPENLLALRALLKDEPYELIEAESGHEAIRLAENQEFTAILLDVQMPILDGFETAKLIRQKYRNRNTPILFVTANHRSEEQAEKGYTAGAVDYIFKPINSTILKAKLNIFSELHRHKTELMRQAALINEKAVREKEYEFLKESLEARDQFLSMASHELKTPITPLNLQMQSFLKMIEDESLFKADPARLKRMLETSYGQVERLSKTIDALLDVSRFTTGQTVLCLEKVNLVQLIRKALDSFAAQLKSVNCDCQLLVEQNPEGDWDPFRIEQVFLNLLSNSMKYGSGKPIRISVGEEKGFAFFEVQDFGIGIAPEDQDRIFKRFERAVSPRFYGGLGLGLFIAYETVRLHHGSIHVESDLGQGSRFLVKLPLKA